LISIYSIVESGDGAAGTWRLFIQQRKARARNDLNQNQRLSRSPVQPQTPDYQKNKILAG